MKIFRQYRVNERREMKAGFFVLELEDLQSPGSAITVSFRKPELSKNPKALDVVPNLAALPALDDELVLVRAQELDELRAKTV